MFRVLFEVFFFRRHCHFCFSVLIVVYGIFFHFVFSIFLFVNRWAIIISGKTTYFVSVRLVMILLKRSFLMWCWGVMVYALISGQWGFKSYDLSFNFSLLLPKVRPIVKIKRVWLSFQRRLFYFPNDPSWVWYCEVLTEVNTFLFDMSPFKPIFNMNVNTKPTNLEPELWLLLLVLGPSSGHTW